MSAPSADKIALHDGLLPGASILSARYPVWLCDVWGVVHNGEHASVEACDALLKHRANGGTVIFITNAPRPSAAILPQLKQLNVPDESFDAIVSSGDVTRHLVVGYEGRNVHHLGPDKDRALLEGLPVNFTDGPTADVLLCSGLHDDRIESPESYRGLLTTFVRRGVPMICANPDRVVRKGDHLIPCAGALADIFEEIGGTVHMAGKPFGPIYDECLRHAALACGRPVIKAEVLAIGDGLPTDIAGAAKNNLDVLFIVEGIHARELEGTDATALVRRVRETVPGVQLSGIMAGLRWSADASV